MFSLKSQPREAQQVRQHRALRALDSQNATHFARVLRTALGFSEVGMMTRATSKIASLKGLGPKSSAALHSIGIRSIDELKVRDPFDVYSELKAKVPGTSLNFLYGLIGAIEDVHWQEVKRTRRTAILLRLEEMGIEPK